MSQIIVVKDSTNSKLRELECDASGNLKVNTVDVSSLATEGTLASVLADTNIVAEGFTACDTGAVVVSSSALPAGAALESSLSSLNGKVSACNTGAVIVAGSALPAGAALESSLAIVAGAVNSGVMQVSAPAAASASHSQVYTAQSIVSGTTVKSTAKDIDLLKSICIFGNSSVSSGEVQIEVSHNNSDWYELNNHYLPVDMSSGDFGIQLDCSAKYVRLSRANSSGSTETINAHISAK